MRRLLLDRACCQRRWCKQEKEEEKEEKEEKEEEEEEKNLQIVVRCIEAVPILSLDY